jgi:hypothetical protein
VSCRSYVSPGVVNVVTVRPAAHEIGKPWLMGRERYAGRWIGPGKLPSLIGAAIKQPEYGNIQKE